MNRRNNSSLVRPRDVASLLGVARSTLHVLVASEGLPAIVIRVGPRGRRTLRFRPEDVQRWLASRQAARRPVTGRVRHGQGDA